MSIIYTFFRTRLRPCFLTMPCALILGIAGLVMPMSAQAVTEMLADPLQFLKSHPSELLNIRSKEEALQIFLQSNPAFISQIGTRQTRKEAPVKIQIPSEVQEAITHIMAGLVALQAAQSTATTGPESGSGHQSENPNPSQPTQYKWMTDIPIYEQLTTLKIFQNVLSSLQSALAAPIEVSEQQYRQYEQYVETHFPVSAEGPTSWINLLKEHGLQGLQNRLQEIPPIPRSSSEEKQPTETDIIRFREHFIHSRLIPPFQARLQFESIELQSEAYKLLLTQAPVITQWLKQEQERMTLSRLCGSWLWTIHNHQNHQDHKMTVHIVPPGESFPPNQPTPSSIALHGDTVYIEWLFPQGRQEDSLLLSNRDSLMEGTFKSTLGPYGSITGKRLSSCKP